MLEKIFKLKEAGMTVVTIGKNEKGENLWKRV